jgi:hypothetical protein
MLTHDEGCPGPRDQPKSKVINHVMLEVAREQARVLPGQDADPEDPLFAEVAERRAGQ